MTLWLASKSLVSDMLPRALCGGVVFIELLIYCQI